MSEFPTIGIAGAGAWGLALANVAANAGRNVVLWGRNEAEMLPQTLPHLLAQDYPGPLVVVVVDDRSQDGTAAVARATAACLATASTVKAV